MLKINIKAAIHHHGGDVRQLLETIMATLNDFIAQQTAFNESMGADVGAITEKLAAIDGDVTVLNQNIADLKTLLASGNLTAEQQVALDTLLASGQALSAKSKTAVTAATALDDRTPPPLPAPVVTP